MEILIYISGLLTALGTVIAIIAFKLNTKYVELLRKLNQSQISPQLGMLKIILN